MRKMIENYVQIDISKLKKAEWNYKEEDFRLSEKLKANIRRNGQVENLIVRECEDGMYEVVNGNHRLDALKELEFTSAVCYNLGKVSDSSAQRVAIETNETKFPTDMVRLSQVIKDIAKEFEVGDLEESLPYVKEELDVFLSNDFDFTKELEDSNDGDEGDGDKEDDSSGSKAQTTTYTCPKCGFDFIVT